MVKERNRSTLLRKSVKEEGECEQRERAVEQMERRERYRRLYDCMVERKNKDE